MRWRCIGPIGGPLVFFTVAALVLGGLSWVTYTALAVERAQREAAAQAELGNNLRVALWRLDGRMLPSLGVEDSRPYYHYAPADPNVPLSLVATPLLAATLPDWMNLHFRLDPDRGWESPQVLDVIAIDQVRDLLPEMPLRNSTTAREELLNDLKRLYPVQETLLTLTRRERAIPPDSLPLAAPLVAGEVNSFELDTGLIFTTRPSTSEPKPPPPHEEFKNPTSDIEKYKLQEMACLWSFELPWCRDTTGRNYFASPYTEGWVDPKTPSEQPNYRATQTPPTNPTNSRSNTRGGGKPSDNERSWNDYFNRAQTIQKGLQESKQSYDYPVTNNIFPAQFGQNSIELKNSLNTANSSNQLGGTNGLPVLPTIGNGTAAPSPGVMSGPHNRGATAGPLLPIQDAKELNKRDEQNFKRGYREEQNPLALGGLLGELATFEKLTLDRRNSGNRDGKSELTDRAKDTPSPTSLDEDRPLPKAIQPVAIHLGSMRPQWITSTDGSDLLVLVRAARLDEKTVYQGVILDWPKLEATLKEEVQDLFPDAQLVPVKDADGISPDRAMTALPVQLDPGTEPNTEPPGWTPLRLGLALSWLAAIIAFAAVGLSGWSLIDLAERRIRFVSAVTHELRTPLTSLRLYLDMLVSGMIQDEAKRQEYLNTLATESDRLHRLIDNVLDFAKLEKRRQVGDLKPVKIREILDLLLQTWTDRLAQDGKTLTVNNTLPAEQAVQTDGGLLQQIMGNLIDNARKYSRDAADPEIRISAKPGRGKWIEIEVEDRGPGVPASERRHIFKPFRRGKQAESTAGGAGLGLALAKSWSEVLGGRLSYRPADGGVGACFRLELLTS